MTKLILAVLVSAALALPAQAFAKGLGTLMVDFGVAVLAALFVEGLSADEGTPVTELPASQMWVVVGSRPTEHEAKSFARPYRSDFPHTKIFLSQNGWYAITIGAVEYPSNKSVIKRAIASGTIPSDSFFLSGKTFLEEVRF